MKKYLISIVAVLVVLVVVLVSYSWAQDQGNQRQGMTEGRRTGFNEMRERFENMTEGERAAFRERMREGFNMSREDQEKAIKAIEKQVAKLKAAIQVVRPRRESENLSEEERTKQRQIMTNRQNALQAIITQVAPLQVLIRSEGEDARFIIINTADLKSIYEMAEKEKATETAQLLSKMAVRVTGRGLGGRQRPGGGQGNQ